MYCYHLLLFYFYTCIYNSNNTVIIYYLFFTIYYPSPPSVMSQGATDWPLPLSQFSKSSSRFLWPESGGAAANRGLRVLFRFSSASELIHPLISHSSCQWSRPLVSISSEHIAVLLQYSTVLPSQTTEPVTLSGLRGPECFSPRGFWFLLCYFGCSLVVVVAPSGPQSHDASYWVPTEESQL